LAFGNPKRKVLITALRENQTLRAGGFLAKRFDAKDFEIADRVNDPDIVLYLEYGYLGLTDVANLIKCVELFPAAAHFIFSEADWPYAVLPGAFPSLHKTCPWAQSWCYLPNAKSDELASRAAHTETRHLFSFLGRAGTHPIRRRLLALDTDYTPCVDIESAAKRFPEFDYSKSYFDLIATSKFVLCPRGFGASSIRIFEAMSLARAPVVISDQWKPPSGVPWREFCVVVPETDISRIPAILSRYEADAKDMGECAREVFNRYFGPRVFYQELLTMLMANYSECGFSKGDNLMRAWRTLGWREIKSLGSQAKSLVATSFREIF
jgi:hypothetical protein